VATTHKTDYFSRPKAACGYTLKGRDKSAESWKFVTCKRCLKRHRAMEYRSAP